MSKVPAGWVEEIFENVISFKNGLNFTKSDLGETIKIVGVGDFKDYSELRSTEHLEYVQVANKVRDEELLKDGDLLFVRSNGNKNLIGRCLFFPLVKERLSFSGFTIRGRVNRKKVLPEYASYLSRSSPVKEQINQNGGGTNISNLSQQILNDIEFLLPPLSEQSKIAKILSTWDKAIATTEQLISNSQQQKKALMQSLLTGKKRLQGFEGEWVVQPLDNWIEEYKKKSSENDQYEVLTSSRNGLVLQSDYFENNRISSRENIGFNIIPEGYVTYRSRSDDGRFTFNVNKLGITGLISIYYPVFYFPNGSLEFFINMLSFNERLFEAHSVGTSQKVLSINALKLIRFKIPPLPEQQKIAQILTAADNEIELLQKKLAFLKQEKTALMQQLLTGKRRVKVEAA